MDVSAQVSMKGAAKCDMHCDLQNSVNQLGSECTLRCWDSLSSKPASVSLSTIPTPVSVVVCQDLRRAWRCKIVR